MCLIDNTKTNRILTQFEFFLELLRPFNKNFFSFRKNSLSTFSVFQISKRKFFRLFSFLKSRKNFFRKLWQKRKRKMNGPVIIGTMLNLCQILTFQCCSIFSSYLVQRYSEVSSLSLHSLDCC